jgi:formylglycine-generating enzyme required for sulfatase activity
MKFRLILLLVSVLFGTTFVVNVLPAQGQTAVCADTYTVVAGDSLSRIAEKYLGSVRAYPRIVEATNSAAKTNATFKTIVNPNVIAVGQKLCIPASGASAPSAPAPVSPPPPTANLPVPSVPTSPPPSAFQATELAIIPAGTLRMGSPGGRGFALDEQPQHDVRMDSYSIERYEVTNAQYSACVNAGACTRVSEMLNGDNFPIVNVTWVQANAYCTWIGRRLPNEAEWERAARGEDNWEYSWSNRPAPHFEWDSQYHGSPLSFCEVNCPVPHFINDVNDGFATTAPVTAFGDLEPRRDVSKGFGVVNMNGNVSEWVSNWYDASAYQQGYPVDVLGSASGGTKVYRGGSWATEPLRLATRFSLPPDQSRNDLGFRCAQ